ncbi:hypothetical protein FGO68_gene8251 [Halteria grandinella]|uniref:Uncharacterized protein n=1 Tax=Halteria grandinella TaxID=5974 RepID=A0A8J8T9W3_HALGN|nr:hypothetical protein FGO68_gene8251 [Halteria grandinella]
MVYLLHSRGWRRRQDGHLFIIAGNLQQISLPPSQVLLQHSHSKLPQAKLILCLQPLTLRMNHQQLL